jgi:hypothetical protein
MTRTMTIGLMAVLAALASCGTTDIPLLRNGVDIQPLQLTSGTSFGMCGGYCVTELSIDTLGVTLTETSQVQDLPPRVRTLPLSARDWDHLAVAVDTAAIHELEGVHGCPDCADGGAEWIQFGPSGAAVRVTFEFGAELDGIEPLQVVIRELRSRFPRE